MELILKQISDLHKIRTAEDMDVPQLLNKTLLKGESFSYQIAVLFSDYGSFSMKITSELKDYITPYKVDKAIMDMPVFPGNHCDNFITTENGAMPDILTEIDCEKDWVRSYNVPLTIWLKLDLPEDVKPGKYDITVEFERKNDQNVFVFSTKMDIEIIDAVVPEQKTKYTQWFYADCISSVHNVDIYSEKHWELIDKYMAMASKLGINMILTPVITPPLDTAEGIRRPDVQLVRIEKTGEKYTFDFTLLKRWIDLSRKNNMKYFEISHLFSQWGLKYAPNIHVYENGVGSYMFGWHVSSRSDEYKDFLNQFIPQLVEFLTSEGVADDCYFHISDEPHGEHIEAYKYAKSIIKPLIGNIKTIDALSDPEFFVSGIAETPIPSINRIKPFLELDIKDRWTYYCCSQGINVSNRFLSMPSSRTRIAGLQMYKYNISGFLQWGYNFYYSQYSKALINPYTTTSAGGAFPSGDPFTVYPGVDGPVPSIRGFIFKSALQDIEICRLLESYVGHDEVVRIIDETAQMNITFDEYPKGSEYIPNVIDKIKERIKEFI